MTSSYASPLTSPGRRRVAEVGLDWFPSFDHAGVGPQAGRGAVVDEDRALVRLTGVVERGADDQVVVAVSIDIAAAGDAVAVLSARLTSDPHPRRRRFRDPRSNRGKRRRAFALASAAILGSPNDDVVEAVVVHVAGAGHAVSEKSSGELASVDQSPWSRVPSRSPSRPTPRPRAAARCCSAGRRRSRHRSRRRSRLPLRRQRRRTGCPRGSIRRSTQALPRVRRASRGTRTRGPRPAGRWRSRGNRRSRRSWPSPSRHRRTPHRVAELGARLVTPRRSRPALLTSGSTENGVDPSASSKSNRISRPLSPGNSAIHDRSVRPVASATSSP